MDPRGLRQSFVDDERGEDVLQRGCAGIWNPKVHYMITTQVKGTKRGPATVLSEAEESMLVEWALEMVMDVHESKYQRW